MCMYVYVHVLFVFQYRLVCESGVHVVVVMAADPLSVSFSNHCWKSKGHMQNHKFKNKNVKKQKFKNKDSFSTSFPYYF